MPNRTQLHQIKLIHTKPNSTTPNQTHPYQTELNHTKPNSSKPNQTKPDNSQPKVAGYAWQNHIQLWLVTCYSVHSCHFRKSWVSEWVSEWVTFVFQGLAERSSASQKNLQNFWESVAVSLIVSMVKIKGPSSYIGSPARSKCHKRMKN